MKTAEIIAEWFLNRNRIDRHDNLDVEGISNLKLQKLLYYAYGCYLAMFGEKLFDDSIVAWEHGPVVKSVYYKYKDNGSSSISEFDQPMCEFSNRELSVLEWVYKEFGQYTAWALRNMTHEEAPWKTTNLNNVIGDDIIKKYFTENYLEA